MFRGCSAARWTRWLVAFVMVVALPCMARAQDTLPPAPSDESSDPSSDESSDPSSDESSDQPSATPIDQPSATSSRDGQLKKLAEENEDLRDELEALREDLESTDQRVEALLPVKGRLSGYLDFGFFSVGGDGTGIRSDIGNLIYPEFGGEVPGSWVFMGDPLSTAINSRGEPAETGESRAITFDSVANGGKSSFIANALNMALFAGVGETLTLNAIFDLVPRSRDASDPDGTFLGDFVDVKLAYAEYLVPIESILLSIYVGKFDSVLGVEYRSQEAPDRLTVSPSLICRYTCGRPLGLKARAQLLGERLTVNASVTNGSAFVESFNFYDEVDSNALPTVAGRLSYDLPIGEMLEVGVSGAYGAQDQQTEDDVRQWHVGADIRVEVADIEFAAEFVKGRAQGDEEPMGVVCGLAPCIEYKGAYGLLGYRLTNTFIPYARVDWRDALHRDGASFVYISKLWRATAGLRAELGSNVIIKGEYTVNRELGRVPQFDNDVFTSSFILRY